MNYGAVSSEGSRAFASHLVDEEPALRVLELIPSAAAASCAPVSAVADRCQHASSSGGDGAGSKRELIGCTDPQTVGDAYIFLRRTPARLSMV